MAMLCLKLMAFLIVLLAEAFSPISLRVIRFVLFCLVLTIYISIFGDVDREYLFQYFCFRRWFSRSTNLARLQSRSVLQTTGIIDPVMTSSNQMLYLLPVGNGFYRFTSVGLRSSPDQVINPNSGLYMVNILNVPNQVIHVPNSPTCSTRFRTALRRMSPKRLFRR